MLLPLLTLAQVALAAPTPIVRKTAVFLIPMDQGAETSVVQLESFMIDALRDHGRMVLKTHEQLFGLPVDDEAKAALRRADTGYREGLAAFTQRSYPEAERKLRTALK